MQPLSRRDLRSALDFIAFLGEARELDEFAARVAYGLDAVIPCHGASYNELNLRRGRARWVSGIKTGPEHVAAFEHHMPENPILNHFAAHPCSEAVTITDLVSMPQFRDLGVYADVYHPCGCEQILAQEISGEPISIAVALFRDGARNFSDRDRALLTLLRPHLANAYRNAEALTDFGDRLALLESGFDTAGMGVIELGSGERVRSMSEAARLWLHAYFAPGGDPLPETVLGWLRRSPASAVLPLVVERPDRRLSLRLIIDKARRLILLREQRKSIAVEELAPLGLSRRESEILAAVADGKTDTQIAGILAISPRTVSHTLERVYRKLGVTTRTAAAAAVHKTLSR